MSLPKNHLELLSPARDVEIARVGVGLQYIPEVAPVLLPHVAHQVRGQQAVDLALLHAIGGLQLGAGVAVQLLVQRLDLAPQAVGLGGDLGRRETAARQVVAAALGDGVGRRIHQRQRGADGVELE